MAYIPKSIRSAAILPSLKLISQGKVGDTYEYPGNPDWLVSVRSDRLSVFDFVLDILVKDKGPALVACSHFFVRQLLEPLGIPHHLISSRICPSYNMVRELKDEYPELPLERTLVVRKATVIPYEHIYRHHLGGSVWKQYQKDCTAGGHHLPAGMSEWQKLDSPIFTPSTKAELGHDINVTAAHYFNDLGEIGFAANRIGSKLYAKAYDFCLSRGIYLLDTKFELGLINGVLTLIDEWLTPDSSRYVDKEEYHKALATGKPLPFMDKQPVRDYCAKIQTPFPDGKGGYIIGFNNLDPQNQEHLLFVSSHPIPQSVADQTTERYHRIVKLLTGMSLEEYQEKYLL